jgi:hypothetical protein
MTSKYLEDVDESKSERRAAYGKLQGEVRCHCHLRQHG